MVVPSRFLVLTVAHARRRSLDRFLASLEEQTRLVDDVILVDAASHENIAAWTVHNYPRVSTLRLFQTSFQGDAWRKGAVSACKRIPEAERTFAWIICTRSDVLFDERALESLAKSIEKQEDVRLFAPATFRLFRRHMEDEDAEEDEKTEQRLPAAISLTRGLVPQLHTNDEMELTPSRDCLCIRADVFDEALMRGAFFVPYVAIESLFLDLTIRLHLSKAHIGVLEDMRLWREEGRNAWPEDVYAHGRLGWKTLPWRIIRRLRYGIPKTMLMSSVPLERVNAAWMWSRLRR
jgi:GT2 family glycosyltransferase